MPRVRLYRTDKHAYHVSVRANNRENFPLSALQIWNILTDKLDKSLTKYHVELHAFVLMSNHFHLLVSTPEKNLDRFMAHFVSTSSVKIATNSGRTNHVFGTRYKPTLVASAISFAYVLKYIYRNPVRAGLCARVEDYPYGTLTRTDFKFCLNESDPRFWNHVPQLKPERLKWLNMPTPKELEDLLRKALRRSTFQFTKSKTDRRALLLLKARYGVETPQKGVDPFRGTKRRSGPSTKPPAEPSW